MPIRQAQIRRAESIQHAAAHDSSGQIRVVAGLSTGKSFAVQERVRWLLDNGEDPDSIFIVSFTRAASLDLRERTVHYCHRKGQPNVDLVNISTLHSLALRALRAAGLLAYPADPLVMDDWELKNVLDAEFSRHSGYRVRGSLQGYSVSRASYIRRDYEAFCGTGQWMPPNYIPPDPPISQSERSNYESFHRARTQTYSCVLPGEIVRQCLAQLMSGNLDPVSVLRMRHLVVDEYQDLNPSDLDFIDSLIHGGVITFVTGDDDQSIYSFRFASPSGIQTFDARHRNSSTHNLPDCFRCTPAVLHTASALISSFPAQNRIAKQIASLYVASNPPVPGVVHRWTFPSGVREARAIASSCSDLINAGLPPQEIMILVSNTRILLHTVQQELDAAGVAYESPRSESFLDSSTGRFIHAILRLCCSANDYVAHRLILGLRPHVGPAACNRIAELVILNNLNYRHIFHRPLPSGVFSGRELTALNHARAVCSSISAWQPDDTLSARASPISQIVEGVFGRQAVQRWTDLISNLPQDTTLEELRDYLWADVDEQRAALTQSIYSRLGLEIPEEGFLPPRVRIMTMHGAKGLNATVVFIPGLEEEILPGDKRRPYPGLVEEAARMLYVSIARARAACVASYARRRVVYRRFTGHSPSRFTAHMGAPFAQRGSGLDPAEVSQILGYYAGLGID
jgi:DNA helicase-2/ATP-dependent DNA helicase PcrA